MKPKIQDRTATSYHWVSKTTGEIVPTFKGVLRAARRSLAQLSRGKRALDL